MNSVTAGLYSALAIPQLSPDFPLTAPLVLPEEWVMVNVSKGDDPSGINQHSSFRSQSMTNQFSELETIADDELQATNGGVTVPPVSIPSFPLTPNSSVPSAFRGQSSGTPGLGDSNLNAAPTGSLASLG